MSATLEALVKRDRWWVLTGLAGVTALAWIYIIVLAASMEDVDGIRQMGVTITTPRATAWTSADYLLMFLMWAIMMVAMMMPSAAPMNQVPIIWLISRSGDSLVTAERPMGESTSSPTV